MDDYGVTTIDLTNNDKCEMKPGRAVEIDCPPGNEMPLLVYNPPTRITANYRKPPVPNYSGKVKLVGPAAPTIKPKKC
jgi:hypothetical protein